MATIVTRSGKGSPLTHDEVDANFNNLNTDKVESLSDLSITATATELNYVSGVTSGIQTQISSIDASKLNLSGGTMTGDLSATNISVTGTVDGRDIAANIPAALGTAGQVLTVNTGATAAEWADASGGSSGLGTLTKSFASGETATITLSSTVSPTAAVAVTKEVGQTGVSSKGAWDVASDAANYELYNEAPATSLSLSSTSVDGTATLGTGSFSSSDLGKRIFVDDGGEAVLTATDGSYSLVSAFGASSYTSGNWSLSGLNVDATNGITLSEFNTAWDVSQASYLQNLPLIQSVPTGIFFKPDGTRLYIVGATSDDIDQYDLTTAWDISTASTSGRFVVSEDATPKDLFFKPDGLTMYVLGKAGNDVNQYTLSTAWSLSGASYIRNESVTANPEGLFFKPDGTKMYTVHSQGTIDEYDLSTAWNISTSSLLQSFDVGDTPTGMFFRKDGLKVFITQQTGGSDRVSEYNLTTAWDVSTLVFYQSFDVSSQETTVENVFFHPLGTKMYIVGDATNDAFEYDVGTIIQPTAQYLPSVTSVGGQIDSTYWTDINSMTADDTDNDGEVYYAVSTDDRTTWSIAKASDGERDIVRNNGGTWEYNSNATYGSETWASATTNNEFAAIAQAMTVAANQMDKAQIDAVADGSHFTLGDTLDLAIVPYLASSGFIPTSDGMSINYDAAALNKGAILGTDYDYDIPATDKVRITSLSTQNLKVRIV